MGTRNVTSELRLSGMAINRCYIKLMVVGDHNVGKTSLLIAFAHNTFSVEPPTMFDSYTTQIGVDDNGTKRTITLAPWDSGGQEDYDRVRPFSYPATDIFLACFFVVAPES